MWEMARASLAAKESSGDNERRAVDARATGCRRTTRKGQGHDSKLYAAASFQFERCDGAAQRSAGGVLLVALVAIATVGYVLGVGDAAGGASGGGAGSLLGDLVAAAVGMNDGGAHGGWEGAG